MFKSRGKSLRIFILVLTMLVLTFQVASAQDRCHATVTKVDCVYNEVSSTWNIVIKLYDYKVVFSNGDEFSSDVGHEVT